MRHFRVGDHVRIAGLQTSEWHDRLGRISEIFVHEPYEQDDFSQECAVDIGGEKRWFMAMHLVLTVPVKFTRFFRAEVFERWQLEADDASFLNGDRDELVRLLCDRFNFSMRRAEAEVDDFYTTFNERMDCAIEPQAAREIRPDNEQVRAVRSQPAKSKNYSPQNVA